MPFEPIEGDVSDLQRMRHVRVPQGGNGLNVKGYAPREIDPPGFFDRTRAALEEFFCVADDDEATFILGGLDQEMSAQLLPTKMNHPLGYVEAVFQNDIDESGLVPLEGPTKDYFRRGKFLSLVLTRLKVGHRRLSPQDLQHARIASSQNRAVNRRGADGATLWQRHSAVSVLAEKRQGLLKILPDSVPIHPGKDSPEGGVGSDQVPRGAQPPTNLLLASEEIDLMEALATKRQSADQEQETA